MTLAHYIIEDGVIRTAPLMEWAAWLECADRHVAETHIGEARISTVFLGLDHNFGEGTPVLFETMIFAPKLPPLDQDTCRYRTLAEAARGHRILVERVKEFYPEAEVTDRACECGSIPPDRAADYSQILKQLSDE